MYFYTMQISSIAAATFYIVWVDCGKVFEFFYINFLTSQIGWHYMDWEEGGALFTTII